MPFGMILGLFFAFSFSQLGYSATVFFANDGFTPNGIEWCEENQALYQILGDEFFEHHNHSIESRICVNLIEDELWTYTGPDRIDRLVEKSRYFVELEIAESAEEAKVGVVDITPANVPEREIPQENEQEIPEEIEKIEIEKIQPEVDEKIVDEGGGCLIATATYGSELAQQVQSLRELRDQKVLQTKSGIAFMIGFNHFYYTFSPTIADWERENSLFKEIVRIIITPLLFSLSLLNDIDIDSDEKMASYGLVVITLNLGMYFALPAYIMQKCFKKLR